MPRTISPTACRRWSKTCTNAPMNIVTRKAMMSAGTARRSAGSAVRRRRYAGLAIDCARPLMESLLTDALAVSTRAMRGPRSDHPDQTSNRKDVPHLPESPHLNRETGICRESLMNF
jgi:hypothetical protein